MTAYIDSEVKEVEGAWIWHLFVLSKTGLVLFQALFGNVEIARRQHRHEEVR